MNKHQLKQVYISYKGQINTIIAASTVAIICIFISSEFLCSQNVQSKESKQKIAQILETNRIVEQKLNQEKNHEEAIKHFLVKWSPFLREGNGAVTVLSKLEKIAGSNNCPIIKKSTSSYALEGLSVAQIKISSTGEFKNLLNFLIQSEEILPLMQIEKLALVERANIISLDLNFKYPIFNESV